MKGCVLFTTLFPGHEDAQVIIQAGITKVVYFDDKYHDRRFSQIAKKLFLKAKVDCERYTTLKFIIVKINLSCKDNTSTTTITRSHNIIIINSTIILIVIATHIHVL